MRMPLRLGAALIAAMVPCFASAQAFAQPNRGASQAAARGAIAEAKSSEDTKPSALADRGFSIANVLPASTPIFLEWRTPPQDSKSLSAVAEVCAEPEMQRFFAELSKLSPEFPEWMFDPDKIPKEADTVSGCFAMRSFGQARSVYPEMLWQFQCEDPDAMLAFMRKILDVAFMRLRQESQGAIGFVVLELDEPKPQGPTARVNIEVVYRILEDRLFLSTSESFLREVVRQRKRGRIANALANSKTYSRVESALGPGSFMRGFINVEGIFATLPASANEPIRATGFDGLKAVGFAIDMQDRGLRERYYFDAPAPRRGMVATWSMEASSRHATAYSAPDSIVFSNVHYDLPEVYRTVVAMYRTVESAAMQAYDAWLLGFEERAGVSLEKELLPATTGEIAVSASLGGFGFAPDVLCAIGIDRKKDPQIDSKIDRVFAAIPGVKPRPAQIGGGKRIVHLDLEPKKPVSKQASNSGSAGATAQPTASGSFLWNFVRPHYCVTEDYLLIGFTPQSVRSALARHASAKNLANASAFRTAMSTVNGSKKETGSILYIDLARLIEFGYNASIPYLQSKMQNLPSEKRFDVTAIPSVETLTKHMFPMIAVMSSDDSGITMESHSPIGSGMLAGFASSLAVSLATKPIPVASSQTPVAPAARLRESTYEGSKNLGNLARFEGRYREAIVHYDAALEALTSTKHLDKDRAQLHFYLGLAHREVRDYDAARMHLQSARDLGYFPGNCEYFLATIAARQGDETRAIEHLQKAVAAGWNRYENLARNRDFDQLRDEPAFRAFIERIQKRERGR